MRRWWTEKYRLPWTHESAQASTLFELVVEFFEDAYIRDKSLLLRDQKGDDGEITFSDTGDDLLDKWEREIAMGLTPDLEEGLSHKEKQRLKSERVTASRGKAQLKEIEGIDDDFQDPRYRSKFVAPGSKEEAELLGRRSKSQAARNLAKKAELLGRD